MEDHEDHEQKCKVDPRHSRFCYIAARLIFDTTYNASIAQAQTLPDPKPFVVFDGTLYTEKPDLSVLGIQSITIVNAGKFGQDWLKQSEHLPDGEAVQRVAREAQGKTGPVVIDIKHWPLKGDSSQVQSSLSKYMTVLQRFKESAPGRAVGYYGAPPLRDYWKSLKSPMSKEWASLARQNDQFRPLA